VILNNPAKVEVTPVSSTAETITQSVYFVSKQDKRGLLQHLLEDQDIKTVLVFTRTKHGADKVVKDLNKEGITAEAIHGNKSQNARQRALNNFKTRQTRVLVATDIAARGIDIDELTHVINYELPNVPETYVHRIGRTGRAGANGIAFSFCDMEERAFLQDIHKLIARNIPVVDTHPYHHNSTVSPLKQQPAKQSAGGNKEQRPHRGPGNNNRPGNNPRNNNNNRNRPRNRQSAPDKQR
jgi:ATP-dependent RNA helicase RhlE